MKNNFNSLNIVFKVIYVCPYGCLEVKFWQSFTTYLVIPETKWVCTIVLKWFYILFYLAHDYSLLWRITFIPSTQCLNLNFHILVDDRWWDFWQFLEVYWDVPKQQWVSIVKKTLYSVYFNWCLYNIVRNNFQTLLKVHST